MRDYAKAEQPTSLSLFRKAVDTIYSFLNPPLDSYYIKDLDYSSRAAYDRAEENHCTVVVPHKNQLQIDIDNDLQYAVYERNLHLFREFYGIESITEHVSKSGDESRKHITITLYSEVENLERLILQAFLGSDLKREFLSFLRIKDGDSTPTLFFEKKPDENCFNPKCKDCDIPF